MAVGTLGLDFMFILLCIRGFGFGYFIKDAISIHWLKWVSKFGTDSFLTGAQSREGGKILPN